MPSKRKRTELVALPWRSQKASINFFSCVLRLILKKTSLLLSVTLMLRCSLLPLSPPSGLGGADPASLSDMVLAVVLVAWMGREGCVERVSECREEAERELEVRGRSGAGCGLLLLLLVLLREKEEDEDVWGRCGKRTRKTVEVATRGEVKRLCALGWAGPPGDTAAVAVPTYVHTYCATVAWLPASSWCQS